MKRTTFLASTLVALLAVFSGVAVAQETDPPSQFELGVQFSSITYSGPNSSFAPTAGNGRTEAGFGGRFTFNLNRHVAVEAETNFFPHESFDDTSRSGRLLQGQFGVKVGKRYGKFGVFGKARPGFASFSDVYTVVGTTTIDFGGEPFVVPVFDTQRKTYFSMDLGGVLEFYPSRRVLTRIDVGDTLIHYGDGSEFFGGSRGTKHNLQVSAGIALRLGSLPPEETPVAGAPHEELQRYEVGAQFSSFSFTAHERFSGFPPSIPPSEFTDTITQPGFGGRFTFNLTPSFAVEAQGDFFPGKSQFFNNARAGGRALQLQAGIKAGKRFEKFGIFGKARPGLVSFSETVFVEGSDVFGSPIFRFGRRIHPSFDLGGVLEFYPSRRIVTRFDAGDTMIRYGSTSLPFAFSPSSASAETVHSFEFSAGVGFRF